MLPHSYYVEFYAIFFTKYSAYSKSNYKNIAKGEIPPFIVQIFSLSLHSSGAVSAGKLLHLGNSNHIEVTFDTVL